MSHELEYPLFPIIEPEYPLLPIEQPFEIEEPISIVISDTPFFYVPDMPEFIRDDYKGLEFEGIQYSWQEFDYRLQVDYNGVPEPSFYGLALGFTLLFVAMIKRRK
jgi:hypothetical protein